MEMGEVDFQLDLIKNPGTICTCFKENCNNVSLEHFQSTIHKTLVTSNNTSQVEAVFTESLVGASDYETTVYTDNNSLIGPLTTQNKIERNTTIQNLISTTIFRAVTEGTIRSSDRKDIAAIKTNIASNFQYNNCFIFVASALAIFFCAL